MTDQSKEFLWFVQFGETYEDCKNNPDTAIKACAKSAYWDLCRTLEYKVGSSDLQKHPKKYQDFVKNKNNHINKQIDLICNCITDNISKSDFPNKLSELRENILKNAKDECDLFVDFHFGQAQKWVNMTVKYMDVMGFWQADLNKHRMALDIPVDSYIIRFVWDEINFKDGNKQEKIIPLPYTAKNGPRKPFNFTEGKVVSWSQWDKSQYDDFQNGLKQYLKERCPAKAPLDWESHAWIKIAKKK